MEASSTVRGSGLLYRYRTGEVLSSWMRSDELRAHVADGRLTQESFIQQRGMEHWAPASKASGLWQSLGGAPGGDGAGDAGASETAAQQEHTSSTAPTATHHTRLAESMQHLLLRALLGHVTVGSPEYDQNLRAVLAGVTGDAIALEFESCGTVVMIPWSRVRSITLPATQAHSTARIRAKAELLVIEVEHLPQMVAQVAQAV